MRRKTVRAKGTKQRDRPKELMVDGIRKARGARNFSKQELEIIKRRREELILDGLYDSQIKVQIGKENGWNPSAIWSIIYRLSSKGEMRENPNNIKKLSLKDIEFIKKSWKEFLSLELTDTQIARRISEKQGRRIKNIVDTIRRLRSQGEIGKNPNRMGSFSRIEILYIKRQWNHLSTTGLNDFQIAENISKKKGWIASSVYKAIHRLRKEKEIGKNPNNRRNNGYLSSMSDKAILEYAKRSVFEKEIRSRTILMKMDSCLYEELRHRLLLDKVGFENDKRRWITYSRKALVEVAQMIVHDHGIRGREEFSKKESGLYNRLNVLGLLGKIGFQLDERNWSKYNSGELVLYAIRKIKEKGINRKNDLKKQDRSLYEALRRRNLLDKVFSGIEHSKEQSQKLKLHSGLTQAADAMEQFGDLE